MRSEPFPDFYLVGAPRCGTTAFYEFLRRHPQIFLPERKELLFFGSDLSARSRLSETSFLSYFEDRRRGQVVGTAHTAYLQSKRAAAEIRSRRPDARIFVLLRNPVEMIPSWHNELLYWTVEDIADLEAALDAEDDRRRGKSIPRNARRSYVESLFYGEVASYAEQVKRYIDAFGREQVHIVLHDDMRTNSAEVCRAALNFLGVDSSFVPSLPVLNAGKVPRSRALQWIYFAAAAPGQRSARRLVPRRLRQRLLTSNARVQPRPRIPEHVADRLRDLFRNDIERLADLLDVDLSGWTSTSTNLDRIPAR